jgi:hypothetical protein
MIAATPSATAGSGSLLLLVQSGRDRDVDSVRVLRQFHQSKASDKKLAVKL